MEDGAPLRWKVAGPDTHSRAEAESRPPCRDSGWDVLSKRIASLESSWFGKCIPDVNDASVATRLAILTDKSSAVDQKAPEIQACVDLLKNNFPSLVTKRSGVKQLIDKADEIFQHKAQLLESIRDMERVQELKIHIDGFDQEDVRRMTTKVIELDALQTEIKSELDRQTEELDEVVAIYEQTMLLLNKTCATWEWRLEELSGERN